MGTVTKHLLDWKTGDEVAFKSLINEAYDKMTHISKHLMYRESANNSLQIHGLVHEAFIRIREMKNIDWKNRKHFYTVCAQMMRRILVDHARHKNTLKRGGEYEHVLLDEDKTGHNGANDFIDLCEALQELEKLSPLLSQIVELRYFTGLNIEDTARILNLSPATVKRKWCLARTWLYRSLKNKQ